MGLLEANVFFISAQCFGRGSLAGLQLGLQSGQAADRHGGQSAPGKFFDNAMQGALRRRYILGNLDVQRRQ